MPDIVNKARSFSKCHQVGSPTIFKLGVMPLICLTSRQDDVFILLAHRTINYQHSPTQTLPNGVGKFGRRQQRSLTRKISLFNTTIVQSSSQVQTHAGNLAA